MIFEIKKLEGETNIISTKYNFFDTLIYSYSYSTMYFMLVIHM